MAKAKVIADLDAWASTRENARLIAKTRLEEMFAWETSVDDPYAVRDLHDLRIAAKRLRYTLEIFQDTFVGDCAPLLKEVEQIQEELGSLHDSDVLIALLRLLLGSQDGGIGYEYALSQASKLRPRRQFKINPELISHVLQPDKSPSVQQRQGLELLLNGVKTKREEQYAAFRQHWYQLKGNDFQGQVMALINA